MTAARRCADHGPAIRLKEQRDWSQPGFAMTCVCGGFFEMENRC